VLRILVLLAIIAGLFLVLPPTPAAAWSSVPFLLLAALFFDAYRRGRRLLLAGKPAGVAEDPLIEGTRWIGGLMLFHTVWAGLGSSGAMADGMYAHGMDAGMGADVGGLDAGGFDAGGGDGGMGGGL
jgi:hypothetical protein